MSFKVIQAEFEKVTETELREPERYKYWTLRLFFEIFGSLDSLAVDIRAIRKLLENSSRPGK